MKKLLLIPAIILSSCGFVDQSTIYRIDPSVKPFVDRFFTEAWKRGKTIKKENLIVVITNDPHDPMLSNGAACTTVSDYSPQRYIYFWSGGFSWYLQHGDTTAAERLVFHEMGHAFRRSHVTYQSIMNPNCLPDIYAGSDSLRTAYVNELISKIN